MLALQNSDAVLHTVFDSLNSHKKPRHDEDKAFIAQKACGRERAASRYIADCLDKMDSEGDGPAMGVWIIHSLFHATSRLLSAIQPTREAPRDTLTLVYRPD